MHNIHTYIHPYIHNIHTYILIHIHTFMHQNIHAHEYRSANAYTYLHMAVFNVHVLLTMDAAVAGNFLIQSDIAPQKH